MSLTTKRCSYCREYKPTTDFHKNKAHTLGLNNTCRACCAKQSLQWRKNNPHKRLYIAKKAKSRYYGIEFTIGYDELVFPSHCPVLGIELDYSYGTKSQVPSGNSPSFDRIDPAKGYVSGNVIIVSQQANQIKNNATVDQLKRVAAFYEQLIPPVGGSNVQEDH